MMDEETKRRVLTHLYGERADQGEGVNIRTITQADIEGAAASRGKQGDATWALKLALELSLENEFALDPKSAVAGLVERLDYKNHEWFIILAGLLCGIAQLQGIAALHRDRACPCPTTISAPGTAR